jgi:hypothetical protein
MYSLRIKIFVAIDFFHNFDHCLIQKIMQISFTLLATCFIIVGILSLTYSHICDNFLNKTNDQSWKKNQRQVISIQRV